MDPKLTHMKPCVVLEKTNMLFRNIRHSTPSSGDQTCPEYKLSWDASSVASDISSASSISNIAPSQSISSDCSKLIKECENKLMPGANSNSEKSNQTSHPFSFLNTDGKTGESKTQSSKSKTNHNKQKRRRYQQMKRNRKYSNFEDNSKDPKIMNGKENSDSDDLFDYLNSLEFPEMNTNENDRILAGNISKITKDLTHIWKGYKEDSMSSRTSGNQLSLSETENLRQHLQNLFATSEGAKSRQIADREGSICKISNPKKKSMFQEDSLKTPEEVSLSQDKNLSKNDVNQKENVTKSRCKIKKKLTNSNEMNKMKLMKISTDFSCSQNDLHDLDMSRHEIKRKLTRSNKVKDIKLMKIVTDSSSSQNDLHDSDMHSIFKDIDDLRNYEEIMYLKERYKHYKPALPKVSLHDLLWCNEKLRSRKINANGKNSCEDGGKGTSNDTIAKTVDNAVKSTNIKPKKPITRTNLHRDSYNIKNIRSSQRLSMKDKQIETNAQCENIKSELNATLDLSSSKIKSSASNGKNKGSSSKPQFLAELCDEKLLEKVAHLDSGIDSISNICLPCTTISNNIKLTKVARKSLDENSGFTRDMQNQFHVTSTKENNNSESSRSAKVRNKKTRIFGPLKKRRRKRNSQIKVECKNESNVAKETVGKFEVSDSENKSNISCNYISKQLNPEGDGKVSQNNHALRANPFVNIQHNEEDYNLFWTSDSSQGQADNKRSHMDVAECIRNDQEQSSSGYVKIEVGVSLDCHAMTNSSVYYLVIEGELELGFMNEMWTLRKGSSFHIPKGNEYCVKNPSNIVPVKLFYTRYFSTK